MKGGIMSITTNEIKFSLTLGLKPVILYVRVSSDEQREGFSIPAQIELLVNYAKKNSMRIVRIFEESMSAKDSGRIEFNKMLKYLKTHPEVNTILVEKTDRLYRNFKDYALIDDNKYEIHLVKENEVLSKDSTSHQKLVHGLKVLLAKNFIDNLREETYKGRKKKAEEGYIVAQTPYGYHKKDPRTAVIVPERAEYVKRCFEYYLQEKSLAKTRDRLNNEGWKYRKGLPTISKGQLHRMLSMITYTGNIEFEGKIFPGKHQAIVSMGMYEKVQELLKKEREYVHEYIFPKVMRCERCGCSVAATVVKNRLVYYHCSGSSRNCKQRHIHVREEFIFNQFTKAINRIRVDETQWAHLTKTLSKSLKDIKYVNTNEKDTVMASIERIKKSMNTLYDDRLNGNISEEFWISKNTAFQNELDELMKSVDNISVTSTGSLDECIEFLNMVQKLPEMWSNGSMKVRQRIAKLVFKRVTLKGRLCKFYYAMPFKYFVDMNYRT